MRGRRAVPDHGRVTPTADALADPAGRLWPTPRPSGRAAAVLALYLAGTALLLAGAVQDPRGTQRVDTLVAVAALLPTVVLGLLVAARRPDSPTGAALLVVPAGTTLATLAEFWGGRAGTAGAWPGSALGHYVAQGAWVWHLAGFAVLCAVFPDGLLPGRRWRAVLIAFFVAAVALNVLLAVGTLVQERSGRPDGAPPVPWTVAWIVLAVVYLVALGSCVASLVVRYRRGAELARTQLRWIALGAGSVPLLLAGGWVAEALGASIEVAYTGFLVAMIVLTPATVAVAILRHDLLDIDRLLGSTLAWVATSLLAASVFAAVVLLVSQVGLAATGGRVSAAVAAFAAALVLLPAHRRFHAWAGRLLDRDRTVLVAGLHAFVKDVRDGRAEPEEVEAVLRRVLADPELVVALRVPGADGYADLAGAPVAPDAARTVPLRSADVEVGALVLGRVSARRLRRAREAAVEVRLPLEVSRLRLHLREALDDARGSRARLVEVAAQERRRLERDLHDGAQQDILAVGMRLRSVQRRGRWDGDVDRDLDAAVLALETIVADLRRLAHGIRPSRLDDGLAAAVADLVATSPLPVEYEAEAVAVPEAVAATAYFVVAESLTNVLKHAAATSVRLRLRHEDAGLGVEVADDGCGGAPERDGLAALRDRVQALGGRLTVSSPVGGGTTVRASFPVAVADRA